VPPWEWRATKRVWPRVITPPASSPTAPSRATDVRDPVDAGIGSVPSRVVAAGPPTFQSGLVFRSGTTAAEKSSIAATIVAQSLSAAGRSSLLVGVLVGWLGCRPARSSLAGVVGCGCCRGHEVPLFGSRQTTYCEGGVGR
jgi:hypothetical protein